jgi:hypothetical protein
MNILILVIVATLGLSESIETRLPEDPGMIYTVGFTHAGTHVGLDWKNRQIVPERACRKASLAQRPACQQAAIEWLQSECNWYDGKKRLSATAREMQAAVCTGADALRSFVASSQLADR